MTDELKKALEAAKTEEEMLAVAREYEHELKMLSDDELDSVAGGAIKSPSETVKKISGRICFDTLTRSIVGCL